MAKLAKKLQKNDVKVTSSHIANEISTDTNSPESMVIAIDGLAGAGKGTIGRELAKEFKMDFLDTGSLYRVVAFNMVNINGDVNRKSDIDFAIKTAKKYLTPELLEQPELRDEEVAQMASKVAAIPEVREALLEEQQAFAKNPPHSSVGAVLDGRDIGTVVCPDADIKLFITASPEVRAKRRFEELKEAGKNISYEQILSDIKERDIRDATRKIAPTKPAEDAIIIDTSNLNKDEVISLVIKEIKNHMASKAKAAA